MRTRLGSVLLAIALLLTAARALAIDLQLGPDAIQEAADAGKQEVSRQHGYRAGAYVLWDDDDPLTIEPGEGQVEAVLVGTPFERLRYRSYLQNYQGKPFGPREARQAAQGLEDTVTFVVFAHAQGATQEDRDFLQQFSDATLAIEEGPTLAPAEVDTFGPSQDFYTVAGKAAEFRYLGSLSIRFDLSGVEGASAAMGTFSFTTPHGEARSFEVDFSRYR